MRLYNHLERRIALPDDSETRRSQKALLLTLMIAGGLLTIINIVTDLSIGLTTAGLVYFLWMVTILSASFFVIAFPRLWLFIGSLVIILVMIMSLVTHLFSGGFQSGLEAAIWMLQGPIAAALFISPRFTIITLLIYI